MKRTVLFFVVLLLCAITNAQDHISFNGATFGQPQQEFQSSMNGHPSTSFLLVHPNKNLYNRYYYSDIHLSTYICKMLLHCSITSNIAFETITWFSVSDLKEELKNFVKVFEEKYGDHIEEAQSELGFIEDGHIGNGDPLNSNYWYFSFYSNSDHHKEMLALNYTIHRKIDNKAIGEIRISAAPLSSSSKGGYIEITYRDLAAAKIAISEYNSVMDSIL